MEMGKWVIEKDGEIYVWFSSLGKYLNFEQWKEAVEKVGKQRFKE